jgi:hypothetical protein
VGLYPIDCPACKRPHIWFSGNMDQRCVECQKPKEWYIQEASEGYQEFVTKLNPDELEEHHPELVAERDNAGPWHHVIEKSAYDFQCKLLSDALKSLTRSAHYYQVMIQDLESQIAIEKAEVSRLLALNKRTRVKKRKG